MDDRDWAPPVGERLTRLETLFETHLAAQSRRDEIVSREGRKLMACVRSLVARLDQFEPVILGDLTQGRKSLDERLATVERVILSARAGWRTATFLGTALFALFSTLAYVLWAPAR